jgi:hypothetical protein
VSGTTMLGTCSIRLPENFNNKANPLSLALPKSEKESQQTGETDLCSYLINKKSTTICIENPSNVRHHPTSTNGATVGF